MMKEKSAKKDSKPAIFIYSNEFFF